jgi:hypothetical protein
MLASLAVGEESSMAPALDVVCWDGGGVFLWVCMGVETQALRPYRGGAFNSMANPTSLAKTKDCDDRLA